MHSRDLDRLAATRYDLLVVGGGIHGLAAAYEGASRGLRTALIDAGDFGAAASFNHQKTAHGGLRALQYGRLDLARQGIFERRALARIAPWLLRPLPFLVGTYRSLTRSRLALRLAFRVDQWLGRKRNEGLEPELHLPAARLVSKAATLRLFQGIRQEGLTGGAQWYDYQMVESERLTFAFAAAADRAGADLATYVEALEGRRSAGRIAGVAACDVLTGQTFEIDAAVTLNAAGAHAGTLMRSFGVSREFLLLEATSLLTDRRASDMALAAAAPSGRMLTLVPWRGRALVGTSQSQHFVAPDRSSLTAAALRAFLEEANYAFPALGITPDSVTLVHRGRLPAVRGRDGRPTLRAAAAVLDHATEGAPGAFTIFGAKYTTARGAAERAITLIGRRLGKRLSPSRTATATLPGAGIADHEALAIEAARRSMLDLPPPTLSHLIARYAERSPDVIRIIHERSELGGAVSSSAPTIGAEVVYAIREEMALRLVDIVIRRTGLGAAQYPGEEAVRACADLAATELGWSEQRIAAEIAAVRDFYRITDGSEG
jgi:glycerol-3-phosphate dehydrogenase